MFRRPLAPLLALSILLHGCAIWWGLPYQWAIDEARPLRVLDAMAVRFSGGWYSAYGPVSYYIYALFFMPAIVAARLGLIDLASTPVQISLQLTIRLIALAMATGIVAVLYLTARSLWDRTTAIFTALAGMSVLPFVYYAKLGNVDVPYTFWALLAIVNYGRIAVEPRPAPYWYFATFATLAVCTKDQAYAFFVVPALHILWVTWRTRQTARLFPTLAGATGWALVLFALCYNVLFNWPGVILHFRLLGAFPERVRMFEPTIAGHLRLAWETVRMLAWSMNWIGFAAAIAGIAAAARVPKDRRHLWLLVPIASYYCTFIMPLGVFYDRYYIAVCMLLSFFAGRFLALVWERRGAAARLGVASALALSVWRGGSINLLMLRDSRLTVEDWFEHNVGAGASVALVGLRSYLPRIRGADVRYYRSVRLIRPRARPDFIVINPEYLTRFPEETRQGNWFERLRSGESGYTRAFAAKSRVPLAILWHERMFRDVEMDPFTNLDKVNPRIEVYQRSR